MFLVIHRGPAAPKIDGRDDAAALRELRLQRMINRHVDWFVTGKSSVPGNVAFE